VVTITFTEFALWGTDNGYHVYGSSAHGNLDYQQVTDFARPAILLLGSERQGLTKEQANICEQLIRLPMKGDVTSLNLAVAAGVLLYGMLEKIEGNA
jgi:tRNA G18 (ribose-2'-O)-methylase SpoU